LPDWLAVIEHGPAATMVTVVAEAVQTELVVDSKLTVSPEVAVAEMPKAAAP
jgi:hypothetical protein